MDDSCVFASLYSYLYGQGSTIIQNPGISGDSILTHIERQPGMSSTLIFMIYIISLTITFSQLSNTD